MRKLAPSVVAAVLLFASGRARAETIAITPSDDFTKIEGAKAGDEVVVAPGNYKFRVFLTEKGTADKPIVIRAQDPKNPPVWDFTGTTADDAPGSYDGGDKGRGCWQMDGAEHVHVSSIVFKECHNDGHNAGGIRYKGGSKGIVVRDSLFQRNDNGITGGSEASEMLVEHCEFDSNGNTAASNPTHNIYIYGGTFALRYSYIHDPIQGQNLHIRAHSSSIDYNWIARGKSYDLDLMSDDDEPEGPSSQEMLFRGNVVVQGTPNNKSQVIAVSNDNELDDVTLKVRVIQNTFVIGFKQSNIVHLDETPGKKVAEISNNVISQGVPALPEGDSDVSGTNNWLATGTAVAGLSASVFGSSPFKDAANKDFGLAAGSNAIGAASQSVAGLPDREYFQNETVTKQYRVRASAKDIGAFESTTSGAGIGAFDQAPAGGPSGTPAGAAANGANGKSGSDDGCGCRFVGSRLPSAPFALVGLAAALVALRRRRTR